ncbi:DUF3995 domain-containing protein [uncultured Tateyamaria sp.]|uniref:DUF3995 domain-containing protein n=1 Tax=uncultured Tateyamaria sp. TaxID=455651 RepID=UPI002610282E|nr:DUF3995 domain-containing protein [uncultured Tateyamaria sp.]
MHSSIAIVLLLVLSALGGLHFYWAGGGLWPGRDRNSLLRIVLGIEGAKGRIPPGPTTMVGVALCVAGILPIFHQELIVLPLLEGALGARLLPIAVALAALTFAVRGLAGYVPVWRRIMSGEPFATLDVRYYSPLCLAISVGFGMLLL